MSESRRIGGLFWDFDGDQWEMWHAARCWLMFKCRRRDGHVSQDGWYLAEQGGESHLQWAGRDVDHALRAATLLVRGEWSRTGLRDRDAVPTWRHAASGVVRRQPEVLAALDGDGFVDLLAIARAEVGYDRGILQMTCLPT